MLILINGFKQEVTCSDCKKARSAYYENCGCCEEFDTLGICNFKLDTDVEDVEVIVLTEEDDITGIQNY